MAVFVDLHVVAGANPRPVFNLLRWVRVEAAGAERPPKRVEVRCQSEYDGSGDFLVGVGRSPRFLAVDFDELFDPLDTVVGRRAEHRLLLAHHTTPGQRVGWTVRGQAKPRGGLACDESVVMPVRAP